MKQRVTAAAAAIALAAMLAGCTSSFLSSPPTGVDQQFTIAVAMKGAEVGCAALKNKALRQGEVDDLRKSLDYVAELLVENPQIDAAELAKDLAGASPEVGAFAPELLMVATGLSAQIPKEQRNVTYFVAVQGVVNQCRRALGGIGTAALVPVEWSRPPVRSGRG